MFDDEAAAVLEGVLAMLHEKHARDISRLAAAALLGKATRVWFDDVADTFRFEVID